MHARNILQHPSGPRGRMHVEVEASVNRPDEPSTFPTNVFQFTYATMTLLCFLAPTGALCCATMLAVFLSLQLRHPALYGGHPPSAPSGVPRPKPLSVRRGPRFAFFYGLREKNASSGSYKMQPMLFSCLLPHGTECRFETQLKVSNDPAAPKVRLLKRVLPATEAQAREIEVFYE
jgi:hypothetical protein